MTGRGVSDLVDDFGYRDELVGGVGEPLSALYDRVGVDHRDGDALGGLAAIHEHPIRRRSEVVLVLVRGLLLLHYVAPTW